MAKFGIGVGEEFPVDEPPARNPSENEADYAVRRRYWRQHFYLHLATRLAFIALIVAFIVWMFIPHAAVPLADGAQGYYGYRHHYFFPFPLLLILLFVLAMRAMGHRRWHHHHHWHDGPRRRGAPPWQRDREEA
jgi:hypothetical protein